MLATCYQEALQENSCLDLLELQDASQHLSWKAAITNEVTFACYLANTLDIQVEWARLHRVGAQRGNPFQCYRWAEESTIALRAALAVVEHRLPTWILESSTTTSLAAPHGADSRGSSASTQCPRYLSPQLGR